MTHTLGIAIGLDGAGYSFETALQANHPQHRWATGKTATAGAQDHGGRWARPEIDAPPGLTAKGSRLHTVARCSG